nr:MAG TPA: hypothetical protein [Caudoviricetes sp.]
MIIVIVISSHAVDIDFNFYSVLKRALKYTFYCKKNKGVVKQ